MDHQRVAHPAIAALVILAVVDVVGTVLAVGHYEHRITVVTHGQPDLLAPALVYDLFDRVPGFPYEFGAVRWMPWSAAAVLAVAAVAVWRRRAGGRLRPVAAWIAAAVLLKALSAWYDAVAAPPGPVVDGFLATRPAAYPLWTVATVVLVVAAALTARTIRRTAALTSPR